MNVASAGFRFLVPSLALLTSSCLVFKTGPNIRELRGPTVVESPVKAHLPDGSVVVFPEGAEHSGDSLRGEGYHYDLSLDFLATRTSLPLDSVLGVETVEFGTDVASTVLVSTLLTGMTALGVVALGVAIFGSCPTVYASSEPGAPMEAELFSYSIAPLAESRDVDRLGLPGALDTVVLDVRNEALETHFINHLELLEITHEDRETVMPDEAGLPLALSDWAEELHVQDRDGRNLGAIVSRRDSSQFASSAGRLAAATLDDFNDHILLEMSAPAADSVAVALRLRNSLLNTVLLYDVMMAPSGLAAADWLGGSLARLGSMAEMGRWYRSRMGLRVEVWERGRFRPVTRVGDAGPLAWKEMAVRVPVPPGEDRLRVRLSFLTDQWRIDQIRIARTARRPVGRMVPLTEVRDRQGAPLDDALSALHRADGAYVETRPGSVIQAVFETGRPQGPRTFFLVAQGYYTEWIRPQWIRTATRSHPFTPSDTALVEALARWASVKASFESEFFRARIPTR